VAIPAWRGSAFRALDEGRARGLPAGLWRAGRAARGLSLEAGDGSGPGAGPSGSVGSIAWKGSHQTCGTISYAKSCSEWLKKNPFCSTFDPPLREMQRMDLIQAHPREVLKNRHRSGTTTSPESKQLL
jgi:hypothetical protein